MNVSNLIQRNLITELKKKMGKDFDIVSAQIVDKNLIPTDIDWIRVIKSYGKLIVKIPTYRIGIKVMETKEEILETIESELKKITPDNIPSIEFPTEEYPIFEEFYYVLDVKSISNIQINSINQKYIDYNSIHLNRLDIWWKNFYANKMTQMLLNK